MPHSISMGRLGLPLLMWLLTLIKLGRPTELIDETSVMVSLYSIYWEPDIEWE